MSEHRQDGDRTPTDESMPQVTVDVAEAARRLGVTPDAIRARLHRGTLDGEKVDGQWRVYLPTVALGPSPTGDRQDETDVPTGYQQDADRPSTGQGSDRHDVSNGTDRMRQDVATADIAPLVEEISRLSRRNEELAAATGMWQARAAHLEERLQQLTATVGRTADAPERDESADQTSEVQQEASTQSGGIWARLLRLLRG
jgi:hypothetical protein